MKYNINHIDVPGFKLLNQVELPDNVIPFKVDYVVETISGSIKIYDSIKELEELFFSKEYRIIEPDRVMISKNNSLSEYKISLRFYYLEKC